MIVTMAVFCAEFHSAVYVEKIGYIMFAAYLVSVIIVLVNILIAMMSNTFEKIQVHRLFSVILAVCSTCEANPSCCTLHHSSESVTYLSFGILE